MIYIMNQSLSGEIRYDVQCSNLIWLLMSAVTFWQIDRLCDFNHNFHLVLNSMCTHTHTWCVMWFGIRIGLDWIGLVEQCLWARFIETASKVKWKDKWNEMKQRRNTEIISVISIFFSSLPSRSGVNKKNIAIGHVLWCMTCGTTNICIHTNDVVVYTKHTHLREQWNCSWLQWKTCNGNA